MKHYYPWVFPYTGPRPAVGVPGDGGPSNRMMEEPVTSPAASPPEYAPTPPGEWVEPVRRSRLVLEPVWEGGGSCSRRDE